MRYRQRDRSRLRAADRVGDTALAEAYVYDTGRTSVRVAIEAWREEPRTGETEKTTESAFIFVAVDEGGGAIPVPELAVETDEAERLQERAQSRE